MITQADLDERKALSDREFLEWITAESIREFVAEGDHGWPDNIQWAYIARQVLGRIQSCGRFWIAPVVPAKEMLARFDVREHSLHAWEDARALYHDLQHQGRNPTNV